MEVKRNSWHYKLSNLGDNEKRNDNLCNYFWRLVGKSALFVFIATVLSILGYKYFTNPDIVGDTLLVIWILSFFVLPTFAILFLREKCGEKTRLPGENIVREFVKAKKNKYCPMIKYID